MERRSKEFNIRENIPRELYSTLAQARFEQLFKGARILYNSFFLKCEKFKSDLFSASRADRRRYLSLCVKNFMNPVVQSVNNKYSEAELHLVHHQCHNSNEGQAKIIPRLYQRTQ